MSSSSHSRPNSILKSISLRPDADEDAGEEVVDAQGEVQDLVELLVRAQPKAVMCSSVTIGSPSSSDL